MSPLKLEPFGSFQLSRRPRSRMSFGGFPKVLITIHAWYCKQRLAHFQIMYSPSQQCKSHIINMASLNNYLLPSNIDDNERWIGKAITSDLGIFAVQIVACVRRTRKTVGDVWQEIWNLVFRICNSSTNDQIATQEMADVVSKEKWLVGYSTLHAFYMYNSGGNRGHPLQYSYLNKLELRTKTGGWVRGCGCRFLEVNLHRLVGCMQRVMLICGNSANVCITPFLGEKFYDLIFHF